MKKIMMLILISLFCGNIVAAGEKNVFEKELQMIRLTPLNNFLFMIPPLAFNMLFWSKLDMSHFPGTMPPAYDVVQNVFRISAMLYPALLPIRTEHDLFKPGLALYSSGLFLYFLSWYSLSGMGDAPFFHTAFAQLAPSYLPVIWFAGIALMSRSIVLPVLSGAFLTMHITEYVLRFDANIRF